MAGLPLCRQGTPTGGNWGDPIYQYPYGFFREIFRGLFLTAHRLSGQGGAPVRRLR